MARNVPNKPPVRSPSWRQPRTLYLTTYNILLATLWTSVLFTTLFHIHETNIGLFNATQRRTRWIQTFSLIEIVHAGTGLIPSPLSTTALQLTTRVIQVWMIWYCFPTFTSSSPAYAALVLAWSVADSVRYVYLALNVWRRAPGWIVWLRYSLFIPLYPIGIASEWWLLYRAVTPAKQVNRFIPLLFYFCLILYIPGAYTMYTYMIRQRRKVLGGGRKGV